MKISLLSQIIRFSSKCPIQRFSNSDHQFFLGALSQKEDDFSWIINQVLRILWFQLLWKPHFENKGNFWINCVCIKALVSWYTYKGAFAFIAYLQGNIRIMACTIRTFVSRHTHKGHLHQCMPIKGHLHHDTSTRSICIMAYPQGASASLHAYKRTFASWYIYKKHLYHDVPIRRRLHRKTFASPSL